VVVNAFAAGSREESEMAAAIILIVLSLVLTVTLK
jgi:hypothetical protein